MSSKEWKTYESMWVSKFRENLLNVTSGYDLSEISRRTGIGTGTLRRYLSGDTLPNAWNCVRLARGLGVPITDIIDYFW